jgi:uncharacterized membrane protein YesL
MGDAWVVVRAALRQTWADVFTTLVVNLLWVFFNLLIVTGPPATMALFYVGNRMARGEPTDPGDFMGALRRYFGIGWRWGAVNLFVLFFLAGDVLLTGRLLPGENGRIIQGFYLTLLVVWLFLQLYVLPLLFEQERPELRQALRNGAVMLGRNLPFSLALAGLVTAVLLAGAAFFMVAGAAGGVFLALVGNQAVMNRLELFRKSVIRET